MRDGWFEPVPVGQLRGRQRAWRAPRGAVPGGSSAAPGYARWRMAEPPISFARGAPAPELIPAAELADCAHAVAHRDGAPRLLVRPGRRLRAASRVGRRAPRRRRRPRRAHGRRPPGLRLLRGGAARAPAGPRARRGAELRPPAQGPRARRRRDRRARRWTTRGSIPTRSTPSCGAAPTRRPSCTRSRRSRTRAGGRSRRSGARGSSRSSRAHELAVLEDDPYGLVRFEGDAPPSLLELEGGALVTLHVVVLEDRGTGRAHRLLRPPRRAMRPRSRSAPSRRTSRRRSCAQAIVLGVHPRAVTSSRTSSACAPSCARGATRCSRALERTSRAASSWSRPDGGYFVWLDLDGVDTARARGASRGGRASPSSRARTSSRAARASGGSARGSPSATRRRSASPRASSGSRRSSRLTTRLRRARSWSKR